jgi:hypothetical protein
MNIPKNFEYIIPGNPNFIKSRVMRQHGIIAFLPYCYANREVYAYYPDSYIERKFTKQRHQSTVIITVPAMYKREWILVRPVHAFTDHDFLKMRKLLYGAPLSPSQAKHKSKSIYKG